jgi:regulatory protein
MATSHTPRIAGPPPDTAILHDAALAYLARYAATELSLRRTLERRIERWARVAANSGDRESIADSAAAAREAVLAVVARLVAAGAVNDTAYAESRARSLMRAGRSRLAVAAHLAAKGVSREIARSVLPDDDAHELGAALVLARRRRLGPFRVGAKPDAAGYRRELAVLARAGFPQELANRVLGFDPLQAEAVVIQLRR